MPLYVYACQQCGRRSEVRQSFQDDPLTDCQHCGGELRRVLQPVGIIFKGSGFYSTDHRKTDTAVIPPATDGGTTAPTSAAIDSTDPAHAAKPAPEPATTTS
jgi:putative FmdB family regulatory protein